MKKNILCLMMAIAAVLFTVLPADGQSSGNAYYEAFVEIEGTFDEYMQFQFNSLGARVTARYDGFVTARIPTSVVVSQLTAITGVSHVTKSHLIETCSDSARYYAHVDPAHLGQAFECPYTGEGVIVGVIDCGFDFNHINFAGKDGANRVKAVYMPLDETGTAPVINAVRLPGSAYETASLIASLTTDDPSTPHGTQVAGIAAGSYRDNGWYGMAPDADIVMCAIPEDELNDVRVANCISYICDYASRKGKPCVINLSLGTNVGPHDGTSYLNRVCRQYAGPGKVFVVSAGNDASRPVYVNRTLAGKTDTVNVLIRGYWGGLGRSGTINAWSKAGKPFNTRLIVVDTRSKEIVYRSRPLGTSAAGLSTVWSAESDTVLAKFYKGSVTVDGLNDAYNRPYSLCDIDMTARAGSYVMGFQYFSPTDNELSIWGNWHSQVNSYGFLWAEDGTNLSSINDMATTDSVISVGAYGTKQYVPLRDGTTHFYAGYEPFELTWGSAAGPDENGKQRPDVCAPGSIIISSANRYDTNPHNLSLWQPSAIVDGVEYPYCPDMGTSMSAAVVSGAVALWLQAKPDLGVADVRDALYRSSYKDLWVMSGETEFWGSGKLDVNRGLRYLLHINDLAGDVNGDGEVNISDINVAISVILGSETDADNVSRADVNGDGEVNISDINQIIDIILNS